MFAWSYEDMPRIDPEIARHHINTHDCMVSMYITPLRHGRMHKWWNLDLTREVVVSKGRGSVG